MKKHSVKRIISNLMVLISIGLLCYPAVAHINNAYHATQVISGYIEATDSITDEEYLVLMEQAREFNHYLTLTPAPHFLNDEEMEWYESLMDLAGTGVMGSLSIPKINVQLPIYHGTSDSVLQVGVGHVAGTSLPVASESSHVVVSGHRGLSTAALFTDLPQLEIGDTFQVTALREVLTYEIDQFETVLPEEVDYIAIEPGMEYCTLVTCTPLGINSHRLLVRGHRIETPEGVEPTPVMTNPIRDVVQGKVLATYEVVLAAIALILFIVKFILPRILSARRKKAGK